jgi:SNF2 family DNA or RNA helicase
MSQERNMTHKIKQFRDWLSRAGLNEKAHQFSGMEFCLARETDTSPKYGVRGGIIADEMGLGKTILMLGCIISNFRGENGLFNTLIILPPALMTQWSELIERFMGHAPLVFHGKRVKSITAAQLSSAPIVVTTYGMIATGRKVGASPLWGIKWNRIIADEAHHLRNMKTAVFGGAKKLQGNIRWMVTGTPIQNAKTDLFALCAVLGLKKAFYLSPKSIREIISHHVLRRTKKSIGIKLPPLDMQVIRVPWASAAERNLAAQIHSQAAFSRVTVDNVDAIIQELTHHHLPMLTRARQCCIFPHLVDKAVKKMQRQGRICPTVNLKKIKTCSKMTAVAAHLYSRRQNGRRKIVFCHYRGEIDLLSALVQSKGITCQSIDGRAGRRERKIAMDYAVSASAFRSVCRKWATEGEWLFGRIDQFLAPQVLIVQIQTGCEGLNLQHFQEVYFTSPHWNPAVEEQAIARSHRIGQCQKVNVWRFLMEDFSVCNCGDASCKKEAHITIDTYCQLVQDRKRELTHILDT